MRDKLKMVVVISWMVERFAWLLCGCGGAEWDLLQLSLPCSCSYSSLEPRPLYYQNFDLWLSCDNCDLWRCWSCDICNGQESGPSFLGGVSRGARTPSSKKFILPFTYRWGEGQNFLEGRGTTPPGYPLKNWGPDSWPLPWYYLRCL